MMLGTQLDDLVIVNLACEHLWSFCLTYSHEIDMNVIMISADYWLSDVNLNDETYLM